MLNFIWMNIGGFIKTRSGFTILLWIRGALLHQPRPVCGMFRVDEVCRVVESASAFSRQYFMTSGLFCHRSAIVCQHCWRECHQLQQ